MYGDDLAAIHDAGFSEFAEQASEYLLELFAQHRLTSGTLVDLGCGSGIWAEVAARHGYDVTGVDQSPSMIELARARVPDANFVVSSMYEVAIPSCRVVTSMGECVNYLPDSSEGNLRALFARVRAAMQLDGLFVFDFFERSGGDWRGGGTYSGTTWGIVSESSESDDHRELTRRMVTFREVNGLTVRGSEEHRLRLYQREEMVSWLCEAGFTVKLRRSYGAYRLPPRHVVVIARSSRR